MDDLLNDDDLKDIFDEFRQANAKDLEEEDKEMDASQRRYQDIIKKHKDL